MEDKKQREYNPNQTEAVLDAESFEEETNVHIPHAEAIEDAKDWIDENEK